MEVHQMCCTAQGRHVVVECKSGRMHRIAQELLNELEMVHGDECGCGKGAIWVRGQAWVWLCSGRVHRGARVASVV